MTKDQEPVAWRTFDGEGSYDYRSYEDNEAYQEEWLQRNPNYKGWVEPLYAHPAPDLVAEKDAEIERLREELAKAQKDAECREDAERLRFIREKCGYVEDGSCQTVRIFQDDATKDWYLTTGNTIKPVYLGSGRSFRAAIDKAMQGESK